jgi:hypothetical protein
LKISKKYLFEKYKEFLEDEEIAVQSAAIEAVMTICIIFDAETKISFLIPLWKRLCAENNTKLRLLMAKHFGQFLYTVKGFYKLTQMNLNRQILSFLQHFTLIWLARKMKKSPLVLHMYFL